MGFLFGLLTKAVPGLNILDNKWVWIGIAIVGAIYGGHVLIASHDATIAQAALANQQVKVANMTAKEAIDAVHKRDAQYQSQIALQKKQATEAQIRNAELDIALGSLRRSNHGLRNVNDKLRSALERTAGRHFTSAEIAAFRASSGAPVLGVSELAAKRIIENQNKCADYVAATQSH